MIPGTNATYADLLEHYVPRPIVDDEQYWATQAVINELLSKPTLSDDEEAYLHLLSLLIEAYDEEHETITELRGVELLQMLMEEAGLKQKDLLPIFKHESVVSEILGRRRKLTVSHIDKLAKFFGLPHQLFFDSDESLF